MPPPADQITAWLEQAEPVIRRVVRRKLQATLRSDDGRAANLDALDLLSEVRIRLLRKLQSGESVEDWAAYSATAAYSVCNDYLRSKYPQRTRLKNALRRLLDKADGFTIWNDSHGELLASYAGHRNLALNSEPMAALWRDPFVLPLEVITGHNPDELQPGRLLKLVEAILDHIGGPVIFDDLIALVGRVLGIEEASAIGLESDSEDDGPARGDTLAAPQPSAESRWMTGERLKLLWSAILQLLPYHRCAYLLNLRDGDIDCFPHYGVATIEEIGEAAALTDAHYQALGSELQWPEEVRAQASILAGAQKFIICWSYLPLEDSILARVLGVTRTQIINYRTKGIERLRRILKGAE